MKTYWGSGGVAYVFLTSAVVQTLPCSEW